MRRWKPVWLCASVLALATSAFAAGDITVKEGANFTPVSIAVTPMIGDDAKIALVFQHAPVALAYDGVVVHQQDRNGRARQGRHPKSVMPSSSCRQRDRCGDAQAARGACDRQRAADRRHALAHPGQAEAGRPCYTGDVAAAVVLDADQ